MIPLVKKNLHLLQCYMVRTFVVACIYICCQKIPKAHNLVSTSGQNWSSTEQRYVVTQYLSVNKHILFYVINRHDYLLVHVTCGSADDIRLPLLPSDFNSAITVHFTIFVLFIFIKNIVYLILIKLQDTHVDICARESGYTHLIKK